METTVVETALIQTIQGLGLDPETVRAELAALAAKLTVQERMKPVVPYDELLEIAARLGTVTPAPNGGVCVTVGTVNYDKKWYRLHKVWATIDGQAIWECPEAVKLHDWRGVNIQEPGHEYVEGQDKKYKRYVAVYWVPPGRTIVITSCYDDLYKSRRNVTTKKYQS